MPYLQYKETKIKNSAKLFRFVIALMIFLFINSVVGGFLLFRRGYLNYKDYRCYIDTKTARLSNNLIPDVKTVEIEIKPNSSAKDIAEMLFNSKLISDKDYFLCYLRKSKKGGNIQAGYFEIRSNISMVELADTLQVAKRKFIRVTIPEGLWIEQIADKLEYQIKLQNPETSFTKSEFERLAKDPDFTKNYSFIPEGKNAEGFIFPDTYEFEKDVNARTILNTMISNFEDKVINEYYKVFNNSKMSIYDIVTLASIIEREAKGTYEEKQMISHIFQKRIKDGWRLESCATIIYIYKDPKHVITVQDQLMNHPYNTYKNYGLTPGPISNPGLDSIKAVLYEKSNPYWFFLHDNNGKIHYAKTYEEHKVNISKYLR